MKSVLILCSVAFAVFASFADGELVTYNDLAPYTAETTDFWQTASHPQPKTYVLAETLSSSLETANGETKTVETSFDTRLSDFLTAVIDGFTTCASPLIYLLR